MEKTAQKRNFRLKMNLACGTDDLRPVMSYVCFDQGYMVATDAHIMIKAKVKSFSDFEESECDLLEGKFLSSDSFKKILACKHVLVTEDGIEDMKTKAIYKFSVPDGKYPNYNAVLENNPSTEIDEIGLQPALAKRMFNILNTPDFYSCRLKFSGKNKAVTIVSNTLNDDDFTAIIIPTMLNN